MHFDDRLSTVLRIRADGAATARIQFRQLLDLLGTLPVEASGTTVDAAYARISELCRIIPPEHRLTIVQESGRRLRSPRLVAALTHAETVQAAAAIDRANLTEEQWLDLIPALPLHARGLVRQRRDLAPLVNALLARLGIGERALPPADAAPRAAMVQMAEQAATADAVEQAEPDQPDDAGIGAIVRRIEAYRKAKLVITPALPTGDSPRLPLDEDHVLYVPAEVRAFDFATDTGGRIVWSDPGVAPMAVGLLLGARSPDSPANASAALVDAMHRFQPLRSGALSIAGAPAIAGDWQVDAVPAFDPLSGRFSGYRGRMRRPAALPLSAFAPVPDSEADRLRQALHELRTPVNAIQGFAEIIQQQLFGPTPHEYRALAATIAGDAARMLAAFEELERLARLDSKVLELEPGETDFAKAVAATAMQLEAHTKSRGSGFAVRLPDAPLPVPLAQLEVERIVWRLLATIAGTAAPGEQIKLRLRARDGMVRLTIGLPASLAARADDALFTAATGSVPQIIAAGVFGVGFALRLVRAEAAAAGGSLTRQGDRLRLELPGLTPADADHSQTAQSAVTN